jgi:membrane-bound lytic murein transglycosylase
MKMKKVTMGIICFAMGALLLSGCSKPNNKATVKSEASTQQSAKKSSESKKESSESSTSESTKEAKVSESSAFKLMIEGAQSQVPKLKEQYEGMYSDISITEGENNTVVYTYTFSEAPVGEVDAEALKPTLVKGLKSTMDAAKVMIPDIKFQVIYLNPDGSEIMNFVITQADTDQVQADTAE